MGKPDPDDLTPAERAALATFAVPPCAGGLADRVLASRDRPVVQARRWASRLVALTIMKQATLALAAGLTLALLVHEGRVLLRDRPGHVPHAAAAPGQQPVAADDAPPAVQAVPSLDRTEQQAARGAGSAERERLLQEIAAARRSQRDEPAGGLGPASGTLDPGYVRAQVREILPLLKECYENALEEAPALKGRFVVRFVISAQPDIGGLIESAEVEEASEGLQDPSLQECLRESMYALRFKPPKDGGQVVVRYPFELQVAEPDRPPSGESGPRSVP